jgi:hypothetical protein
VLLLGAGPAGLELAGEIKAFFPEKDVTVADISDDILAGPYDQRLREELRASSTRSESRSRSAAGCASCRPSHPRPAARSSRRRTRASS